MTHKRHAFVALWIIGTLLSGCGGGGSSDGSAGSSSSEVPESYTLGGSITGLTASGLVLVNETATVSPVAGANTFTFSGALTSGSSYNVTVQAQPIGETCTVASGNGTIGTSPVTSVRVTCQPQEFVYAGGSGIYGYSVNFSTGELTRITGSPFGPSVGVQHLASDPAGHFIFAVNGNITAYRVNPGTGELTTVSGSPFSADGAANSIAVDPSGRFLYAAAFLSRVYAYTIDSTEGTLTPVPGSPFAVGPHATNPQGVAVDASGKFVYVASSAGSSNTISAYATDQSTGALTEISGSPFSVASLDGVCSIATSPHGDFVYVFGISTVRSNVMPFTIDPSTGALEQIAGGNTHPGQMGGSFCGDIVVHPSGMNLYFNNFPSGLVWNFSANLDTGVLTVDSGTPLGYVAGIAVDPLGQYLYATTGNRLTALPIDPLTGGISPPWIDTIEVSAPAAQAVIAIRPSSAP